MCLVPGASLTKCTMQPHVVAAAPELHDAGRNVLSQCVAIVCRFPSSIKAAILTTLGLLVGKAGPGLKPFVPQLQTTFLKCLNDAVSCGCKPCCARVAVGHGKRVACAFWVLQGYVQDSLNC